MELCVLGSGSGGNASLVRLGERCILIDAGFGPRAILKRLVGTGVGIEHIDAILVTHLDSDHFRPTWFPAIAKRGIKLYVHERHTYGVHRHEPCGNVDAHVLARDGLLHLFNDEAFDLPDTLAARVHPFRGVHDSSVSIGYRIEHNGSRLTYATDVGRVDPPLIDAMVDADLIAIESNYDPPMQMASPRPQRLKKRIMGGRGHLSNAEAANAVAKAVARSQRPPCHVALLHLSRQCNDPKLARRAFATHSDVGPRVCVTHQYERTEWLRTKKDRAPLPGEQLSMGW